MHTKFVQKEIWTIPYKTLYIIRSLRNDPLALSYETQVSLELELTSVQH